MTRDSLRVAVKLPTSHSGQHVGMATATELAQVARTAEASGFDALTVTDHPFPPTGWADRTGHQPLDPFVALATVAATTSSIRLQTGLLVLPYRSPFIAARALASLDVVSGGRVVVGVAPGYLEDEFAALGADHARRNELVDTYLRAMRCAWTGDDVRLQEDPLHVPGNRMLPRPRQNPLPVLAGGNSRRAIRRAVELADGWAPMVNPRDVAAMRRSAVLETPDDLRSGVTIAREEAETRGRTTPLSVSLTLGRGWLANEVDRDPAGAMAALREWHDAGADQVITDIPGSTADEWCHHAVRIATLLTDLD